MAMGTSTRDVENEITKFYRVDRVQKRVLEFYKCSQISHVCPEKNSPAERPVALVSRYERCERDWSGLRFRVQSILSVLRLVCNHFWHDPLLCLCSTTWLLISIYCHAANTAAIRPSRMPITLSSEISRNGMAGPVYTSAANAYSLEICFGIDWMLDVNIVDRF